MRKKSHLLLARSLAENLIEEKLYIYRKSFYIGSIIPDCVLTFLIKRHCIDSTFDIVKKEIILLTQNYNTIGQIDSKFCRHLGILIHYIADYYTFPHNSIYNGSMREHCAYEEMLKIEFRKYIKNKDFRDYKNTSIRCSTAQEICNYIKEEHKKYLTNYKNIDNDIYYITKVCYNVVNSIFGIIKDKEM